MGAFGASGATATAVMRRGAAMLSTVTATTVLVNGGEGGDVLTTDGPFAESKEVFTGLYLLDCADPDEAVRGAAQIPAAGTGKVEIRPDIDFGASAG